MSDPTTNTLLRLHDVMARTAFSKSQIYKLAASTDPRIRFPSPVKIGRASRWPAQTVQAWIDRQGSNAAPDQLPN